ncbi:hypothetical protein SAMN05216360_11715 [Methylobacterium phyllostachyos]|uniref:Uncharacterized protein n=1 Tax=Methylobacterium phyllostachyos TaxID=582672 RepID=A0A1H0HU36_9HYPH|nr:hypothetical protein [Methylobacterium phyllostachyos]SDO22639.1 hypothetical protein SAMN05216360_11715 [Methylobacterium phyllostachyos]
MHPDVLDGDFHRSFIRKIGTARARVLFGLAGLTAFGVAGIVGPVQAGSSWQRLSYSDPRHPGPLDAVALPLWQRELAGKPFYQVHAARFEDAGTTYLVSVAFAGGICTMGANDRNAVAEPAICPVRVDVIQGGTIVKTVRSKVCSVAPLPEDTTANQTDATEVAFDAASQAISFRSRLSGRWVRLCQRQVKVR